MGKWEIRPIATPRRLNRSPPTVRSWTSTDTQCQYLVTMPQEVSFPRMCEIAHQKCLLGFFFPGSSNSPGPEPIFTQNTANDVVLRKDVPFRVIKQNLTFSPPYSRQTAIFGLLWLDFFGRKIFGRKPLYTGNAPCKLPLIVIVAL